jgi:hypothetical protein
MITLPAPPRRAHLRAFCFALCALLGSVAIVILRLLGISHAFAVSAVAAIALTCLGFLATESIWPVYAIWNKAAQLAGRLVRLALTAICFFIVFAAVGRLGARFDGAHSTTAKSSWVRRRTRAAKLHSAAVVQQSDDSGQKGWMSAYMAWAIGTGNLWAVVLLPFLSLLALVAEDQDEAVPVHVYTLF